MLTPTPLYREISSLISARENCRRANNGEWLDNHSNTIAELISRFMPSGSGIDCGTKLDDCSTPERLVFNLSFHHMDENGFYDGWTEHQVIVKPSLQFGVDIRITGRDKNQIKEYLHEVYGYALTSKVWQTNDCGWHSEMYEKVPC